MYQCTACGLLSVRDVSCPACGGANFLDLEAEDTTSLEGFGEVPGLDEAASALHEIAPPPEKEDVEEEPNGDLPFGFGGLARSHAPSLPFGFGASSQGLSAFTGDGADASTPALEDDLTSSLQPMEEADLDHDSADDGPSSDDGNTGATVPLPLDHAEDEAPQAAPESVEAPRAPHIALPAVPEPATVVVEAPVVEPSPGPSGGVDVPELWSGTTVDVRGAYGLPGPAVDAGLDDTTSSDTAGIAWPPFAVVTPEAALLNGLLREATVDAFRALAEERWALAQERLELLFATGIDGVSLRTAAGIACMEHGDDADAGLQHLKQAAKLSGGNLTTLHNLAVAMAMDGRTEGVDRLLASVVNLPDEGGFVSRMREARNLMKSTSA